MVASSSTGELIFDNVKVPKKICYQTNLVWGTTWMLRFSTLRNRLGLLVLWIVMTALRYAKDEFNLTNQLQERNYSKRN
jgi:hypothetical protein